MSELGQPQYWATHVTGWKQQGTDPRYVVGVHHRVMPTKVRRDAWLSLACVVIFGALLGTVLVSPAGRDFPLGALFVVIVGTNVVEAVVLWRRSVSRVELDPHGITVVNAWRTRRFRWAAIDAVVADGRPGVTLLTADSVLVCDALRSSWRWPFGTITAKPESINAMNNAAVYLEATRAYYANESADQS